jgi:hypothetical protein
MNKNYWERFIDIGKYRAYDVAPSTIQVSFKGITFGNHTWTNALTHARAGEYVRVYTGVGALSDSKMHAIVVLDNGRVESWQKGC